MSEADLFDELRQATEAYKIAEFEASTARGRETAALNRVNNAQKAITVMMDKLKKESVRDSDWRRAVPFRGQLVE